MVLTLLSVWGPTVHRGKADVEEHPVDALRRSSAVMVNGTVLRRAGTRKAAGAAVAVSSPVVSQVRDQSHQAILLAGLCVTLSLRDVTTSSTALTAVMRKTVPCASLEPFIVTVIGVCLRRGAVMVRWIARMALMK